MPQGSDGKRQAADYIAEMAQQLARLAAQNEFFVLQHVLQMAWQEARTISHSNPPPAER